MNYINAFEKEKILIEKFREDNAYLCWVMALFLDRNDVMELATDGLTDGKNDKKIDFIDLDIGNGKITLAQGYYSKKERDEAPANKASDLNTALAWLISGNILDIPESMRDTIQDCREAIKNNEISLIEVIYVHNLPESKNCKRELETIATHQSELFEKWNIEVIAHELGKETIENLYISKESQILVREKVQIMGQPLFKETANGWEAYIFSVTGKWLFDIYNTYGEDLFSANYRGFLGVGKRKKINNMIRQTVENEPSNFWVYNNGITILTLRIEATDDNNTIATGISIINGAQTTGSISTIDKGKVCNLDTTRVLCRIIKCEDTKLIPAIVKANNTQNEITSWDRYSNDSIQISLREEFRNYNKEYSLKRGFDDTSSGIGIYTVAQPVLAFEGNFSEANRGKNNIFKNNYLYKSVFEEKSARHLLLVYSLSKAIDEIKYEAKEVIAAKSELKDEEKIQISLFRNLKFKMFFIALVAECIEVVVDFKVDKRKIAFSAEFANEGLVDMIEHWKSFAKSVLTLFVAKIKEQDLNEYIHNKEKYIELCSEIKALFEVLQQANSSNYEALKNILWQA